jgi:hypothetical protein
MHWGDTMSKIRIAGLLANLAAALICLGESTAYAAYSCTVTATSVTMPFAPTVTATNVQSGSYTINCTRAGTDPNTLAWSLANDNGGAGSGGNNTANGPGGTYAYDTYMPGSLTNKWGSTAATRITGTMNFGASLTASASGSFDVVVTGPQTVLTAGNYTDTIGLRLRNTGTGATIGANPIASFVVTLVTSNYCQISVAPGDLNFIYTSFQAGASSASSTYGVRCTLIPFTMALDATSGTLLGLNYTVSLATASSTGTGVTQTFTINGSIAGGQSGTCATATCSGSQTRTLTVTY